MDHVDRVCHRFLGVSGWVEAGAAVVVVVVDVVDVVDGGCVGIVSGVLAVYAMASTEVEVVWVLEAAVECSAGLTSCCSIWKAAHRCLGASMVCKAVALVLGVACILTSMVVGVALVCEAASEVEEAVWVAASVVT